MGPAKTSSRQRLLSSCCRGQVGQCWSRCSSTLPCLPSHSGTVSGTACVCVQLWPSVPVTDKVAIFCSL